MTDWGDLRELGTGLDNEILSEYEKDYEVWFHGKPSSYRCGCCDKGIPDVLVSVIVFINENWRLGKTGKPVCCIAPMCEECMLPDVKEDSHRKVSAFLDGVLS